MRFTSVTVASGVSFHLKVTILSFSSFTISFPFFFFFLLFFLFFESDSLLEEAVSTYFLRILI